MQLFVQLSLGAEKAFHLVTYSQSMPVTTEEHKEKNHLNGFNFGNRKPSGDISDEKITVTNMTRTMMMMTMMTVIFSGVLTR